jgi:hypothetical protein
LELAAHLNQQPAPPSTDNVFDPFLQREGSGGRFSVSDSALVRSLDHNVAAICLPLRRVKLMEPVAADDFFYALQPISVSVEKDLSNFGLMFWFEFAAISIRTRRSRDVDSQHLAGTPGRLKHVCYFSVIRCLDRL